MQAKINPTPPETETERSLQEACLAVRKDTSQIRTGAQSSGDFYFSPSLGTYVSLKPMVIEDRIARAAGRLNIPLEWDDQGRICNISFTDARRLLHELDSRMLSPREYWTLFHEVAGCGDEERLAMIASDTFTEWLDAVFRRDENGRLEMIEHPIILQSASGITFEGATVDSRQPDGRPGWFRPVGNIDSESGMPVKVDVHRAPDRSDLANSQWKYWATPTTGEVCSAIRGYVTSSGTPSLDLGIPASAVAPVLMIREARVTPVNSGLDPILGERLRELCEIYQATKALKPGEKNADTHQQFYSRLSLMGSFSREFGSTVRCGEGQEIRKIRGTLADMFGAGMLECLARNDAEGVTDMLDASRAIFGEIILQDPDAHFRAFVAASRVKMNEGLEQGKPIVFVMGHPNSDCDTAVSALLEAWRSSLVDPSTAYVPIMQSERIPDEIYKLLGAELSAGYVLEGDPIYQRLQGSGRARWILVDHNTSHMQRFAIGIVDHHTLSDIALNQDIAKTWEMVGSCSGQIAQKIFGIGVTPGPQVARLLYAATLMDTENRLEAKMTYRDRLVMDRLRLISGVTDDGALFHELMSALLSTTDSRGLFDRDYKQDWGTFGFAVAKVKECFNSRDECQRPQLVCELLEHARTNNRRKNLPLTLVKLVNYQLDNERVERERMYIVFNEYVLPEFREAMYSAVETLARHHLGERTRTRRFEDCIEYRATGAQLSRKVVAPVIEKIVKIYNGYFFSRDTALYVARDFLKDSVTVREAAKKPDIPVSTRADGTLNYISFEDSLRLTRELGYRMLTLPEYWKVYHEAKRVHDEQMCEHLVSATFAEYLDTVIVERDTAIHHPELRFDSDTITFSGVQEKVDVLEAVPGLIRPEEIDPDSGLPMTVHQPNQYGNRSLWRYWSPDADLVVPTRGHIFLHRQSALDLKVHPGERFANLGIRLCTDRLDIPAVQLRFGANGWEIEAAPHMRSTDSKMFQDRAELASESVVNSPKPS